MPVADGCPPVKALTSEEIRGLRAGTGRFSLPGFLARFVVLVAMVAACGQPPPPSTFISASPSPIVVRGCELLEPTVLISGMRPGPVQRIGPDRFAWGSGLDHLTEAVEFAIGHPDSFGIPDGSPQRVIVRGEPAVVVAVGDDGVGQVVITWLAGDCPYTVWLAAGVTMEQAVAYAPRF